MCVYFGHLQGVTIGQVAALCAPGAHNGAPRARAAERAMKPHVRHLVIAVIIALILLVIATVAGRSIR